MNVPCNAAVVVPVYKTNLSELEKIALTQCLKVLSDYPIIAIKPDSLDLSAHREFHGFTDVISFPNFYFGSISGYNELMLSPLFYEKFPEFEFILIHQLDAFVFENSLAHWCGAGYDYIGAPWIRPIDDPDIFKNVKTRIQRYIHTRYDVYKNGLPSSKQFENRVGNGGFSLRRVPKFRELTIDFSQEIQRYHQRAEHQFHEDAFWSIEVNRNKKNLKIPLYREALHFSIENFPERAYRLNGNQLPFGCHAWDKYVDFWRPFFQDHGYHL